MRKMTLTSQFYIHIRFSPDASKSNVEAFI